MENVFVGESKINGKGVFAAKNFRVGEVVLKWHPRYLEKAELENYSEEEQKYIYPADDNKYLYMQLPERFVNHSCDPNTKTIDDIKDIAIKNIKKGEEITSDYGHDITVSFQCKCGSRNCRGMIK